MPEYPVLRITSFALAMKSIRIAICLLTCVACAATMFAKSQLTVWDKGEQAPVVGASVISSQGIIMGVTDVNGGIKLADKDFPVSVRSIGYESATADNHTDTLFMAPATYAISEVTVSPASRPITRVVTYAREYCTGATPSDTMQMYGEYMLEYFFADGKVKGFKKSDTSARELNRRCYGRLANSAGLDSLLRPNPEDDISSLSFMKIISLVPGGEKKAPETFMQGATTDTVQGKFYPKVAFRKFNDFFTVDHDALADYKDHHWEPWFFKMFGLTMDLTTVKCREAYRYSDSGKYTIREFLYGTCNLHIIAKGKLFKKIMRVKDAMEIDSYIEEYPVSIEYLTPEEYKELRNEKNRSQEFVMPANTLPLAPAIQTLIDPINHKVSR